MSDIVERLRASIRVAAHHGDQYERSICGRQMTEAATEIERLRAELAALRRDAESYLDQMVQAFLGWPLPKSFSPDCGISFDGRADDTGKGGIVSDDPREIYLQPECCADPVEGRLWCEDDEPQKCEEGVPWTRYVVGWEYDRLRAEFADHKAAFNKLNEVLAENLEDRKRLRAEIAKLREAADNNDAAFIDRMTVERTRLRALLRVAGAALRQVHEGRRHPQLALSIIARIDAALSKEKP